MNEPVLASVANFHTSFTVWRELEQKFSSQTKAHLLQLKGQFSHISKGNLPISEYVEKVQSIANSLAIAGSPVSSQDLVLQLLNGLGPEFDHVVSGITSRSDLLSFEEVQALLLSHETWLEHHNTLTDLSLKMQANLAYGSSKNTGSRLPIYSSRGPSGESGRGRGYARGNGNRLVCQVCLRTGHTAAVCHYRFDKNCVTTQNR
ncbi:uncharacterized protein LOC133799806 [Humulus lupulus]|uniref:uncharacterized protein LOC133799806 n=1 Tax=Humulus lupulus TaxID=3486 RepID=UPI002B4184C8|nr:uncharacterized protein LOC133799806 [Humulus lupulus]